MVRSAALTARGPIEVCAWLDDEDETADRYPQHAGIRYGAGPRPYVAGSLCTSGLWNNAWSLATGEIACLAADDIIFRTHGWDMKVEAAFEVVPDRILMVYADDGTRRKAPVNPFVHRRWIQAAGFTPDDYQGWFADEWLWQLAAELGRVVFLDDVRILHVQKRGSDATYRDGEAAREAVGGWQGMRERFYTPEMVSRRQVQLEALRALKWDDRVVLPDPTPPWLQEALERSGVAVE
jgi:hypothetical protein